MTVSTEREDDIWVSSGKRRGASGLSATVESGDDSGLVLFRHSSIINPDIRSAVELVAGYEIRFSDYHHEWFKDWDRNAKSKLHWHALIIDGTGQRVPWDSVEVAAHASPDAIDAAHMQKEYYRDVAGPATSFGVDWEKDGADPDFQSAVKCYLRGTWWLWSFGSHC